VGRTTQGRTKCLERRAGPAGSDELRLLVGPEQARLATLSDLHSAAVPPVSVDQPQHVEVVFLELRLRTVAATTCEGHQTADVRELVAVKARQRRLWEERVEGRQDALAASNSYAAIPR
jgi:hypothetical protein